jgi:hypothetical protein
MHKDKIEPGEPAIGFSLDCKINDRRAIVMQSYLPIDAKPVEINRLLEKMLAAADRTEIRYRLKDLKLLLEKHEQELPMHEKDLETFENRVVKDYQKSGRGSEFKWKGTDAASRDNKIQNIATMRIRIEHTKKAISEAEAELGIKE